MNSYFLSVSDIQLLWTLVEQYLPAEEPVPPFEDRYPGVLEGVISIPQSHFYDKFFYPALPDQGAVLFYEMIKTHPFLNGNKRIACIALICFFALNNLWLNTSNEALYNIAISTSKSKTTERDEQLFYIKRFIEVSLIDFQKYFEEAGQEELDI
jgi:death on curing protein